MISGPGAIHTASLMLRNPSQFEYSYLLDMFLSKDGVRHDIAEAVPLIIPAVSDREARILCTFPGESGTYVVLLDISVDEALVAGFIGIEAVTIEQLTETRLFIVGDGQPIYPGHNVWVLQRVHNVGVNPVMYTPSVVVTPTVPTILGVEAQTISPDSYVFYLYRLVPTALGTYQLVVDNIIPGSFTVTTEQGFRITVNSYSLVRWYKVYFQIQYGIRAYYTIHNPSSVSKTGDIKMRYKTTSGSYVYSTPVLRTITLAAGATSPQYLFSDSNLDVHVLHTGTYYDFWFADSILGKSPSIRLQTPYS